MELRPSQSWLAITEWVSKDMETGLIGNTRRKYPRQKWRRHLMWYIWRLFPRHAHRFQRFIDPLERTPFHR